MPSVGKGFFNNSYAFIAAAGLIVLQAGFVYVPFMNPFFESQPIELNQWIYPLTAGFLVFVIVEAEKFIITKING